MVKKARKPNQDLIKQVMAEPGFSPPEDVKPWEVQPWNKDNIEMWLDTDKEDFSAYVKAQGMDGLISETRSAPERTTLTNVPASGLDLTNSEAVIQEVLNRIRLSGALAMPSQPVNQADDMVWVEFPEPIEIEFRGQDMDISLEPINVGGLEFSGTGYYKPEIAKKLQSEIDGAEVINIPQNAAFITHTYIRTDHTGVRREETEMYVGPVFAGKTLATSLKKQMSNLEEINIPSGLIPGSQTHHSDLTTNGVRFVVGHSYLVSPKIKKDMDRRIASHVRQFQDLHQPHNNIPDPLRQQGGRSQHSNVVLDAKEAEIRFKKEGYDPSQAVKSAVPAGDFVGR